MKHFLSSPLSFVTRLTMASYLQSNYFCISHLLLNAVWKFGIALQSQISATPTQADVFPFYMFGNSFKK